MVAEALDLRIGADADEWQDGDSMREREIYYLLRSTTA